LPFGNCAGRFAVRASLFSVCVQPRRECCVSWLTFVRCAFLASMQRRRVQGNSYGMGGSERWPGSAGASASAIPVVGLNPTTGRPRPPAGHGPELRRSIRPGRIDLHGPGPGSRWPAHGTWHSVPRPNGSGCHLPGRDQAPSRVARVPPGLNQMARVPPGRSEVDGPQDHRPRPEKH